MRELELLPTRDGEASYGPDLLYHTPMALKE